MSIPEEAFPIAIKAFAERGSVIDAVEAAAPILMAQAWEEGLKKARRQSRVVFLGGELNPYQATLPPTPEV